MTWLNWPNRITIVRILLIVPLVLCLLNINESRLPVRRIALVLFCLIALGDALDGYLARLLHEETPLGRFLDPLADKLLMTCSVILLALPSTAVPGFLLPNWVTVMVIGKDLLVTIGFGLVYATTGQFFVKPRILGKTAMLTQSVMIAAVLLAPDLPATLIRALEMLYYVVAGLAAAAAIDYLIIGNRFARETHRKGGPGS